jgi:hypothetical protein
MPRFLSEAKSRSSPPRAGLRAGIADENDRKVRGAVDVAANTCTAPAVGAWVVSPPLKGILPRPFKEAIPAGRHAPVTTARNKDGLGRGKRNRHLIASSRKLGSDARNIGSATAGSPRTDEMTPL